MRTASFPEPGEFAAWYERQEMSGAEMLDRVRDITKMRRSTGDATEPPVEAVLARKRVEEWRANGGKVACAFGKVVCDLAVPRDGGPAHANFKEWLNNTIDAVRGSNTLLLLKPHPHELNDQIGSFLTEFFTDLIDVEVPPNVLILGHRWFDIYDLNGMVDLGLLYNGTTAVEFGLLGIPVVLCSNFAPVDYPVGHVVPRDRPHYERLVRFEDPAVPAPDLREKAAAWLHYMSGDEITVPYRYHARPVTNKVINPSWWFKEDIRTYIADGDPNVTRLAMRIITPPVRAGEAEEPQRIARAS